MENKKFQSIKCKCGVAFAATVTESIDASWKLQAMYYKAQGCLVVDEDDMQLSSCDCDHRKSLVNEFDSLIEEIIEENC